MRSKRPWHDHAHVRRVTYNSGDVKFLTFIPSETNKNNSVQSGTFESLTEAEANLDAWFKAWWPQQVKSTRRA